MRVALARALFLPTVECLILDEPTNHLGKKAKQHHAFRGNIV